MIKHPPIYAPKPARSGTQKLRVGIILLDKFTLNAFAGFIDAIRLASDQGGRSRQIHCGWEIMGPYPVQASCGMQVTPTSTLLEPALFDYIVVSGGNSFMEPQPPFLDDYLKRANADKVPIVGLCTGTFNIANAGLMKGYTACIHWNMLDAFRELHPNIAAVTDRIFLDSGSRITCAGSAGGSDLALHLIARHCGYDHAMQSIRHMMLRDIRPASFPQAHFFDEVLNIRDTRVRRAIHFMEQSLNSPPSIGELAACANTSQRQLERLFDAEFGESPATYFRKMRLRYGAWVLRHSTASISHIAVDTGFADASHFGREFKALTGVTPRHYREQASNVECDV